MFEIYFNIYISKVNDSNDPDAWNELNNIFNNQNFNGFIGQVAIEPVTHDSVSLEKIFTGQNDREMNILKHSCHHDRPSPWSLMEARVSAFEPMAKNRVPHLLHFDIEQLVHTF